MKNSSSFINRLHVLMFSLLFWLFACQEEQIANEVNKDILLNVETFTFTYRSQEYTEQLAYLPSSPLDVPLPENEILLEAMQQPEAAIFMNIERKEIGIFDSVEEAKRLLGISSEGENLLNQRLNNQQESDKRRGLVTLFETSDYNSSPQEDWMTVYIGYPSFTYRDRVADLSAIVVSNNRPTINLDRRVSSIRIANLSSTKWLTALLYENKNYSGRALILQCPPDLIPSDYSASFLYTDLQAPPKPPGDVTIYFKLTPTYYPKDYYNFSAISANCSSAGYVSGGNSLSDNIYAWNNKIRSVEVFFTSKKYSNECVPF